MRIYTKAVFVIVVGAMIINLLRIALGVEWSWMYAPLGFAYMLWGAFIYWSTR